MNESLGGHNTRRRFARGLNCALIFVICMMVGAGTYAGVDRQDKQKKKQKSEPKKEEPARRDDAGSRVKETKREGRSSGGSDRTQKVKPKRERPEREPWEERDRDRKDKRKKKENPGYKKKQKRGGEDANIKVKVPSGRREPPTPRVEPVKPRPPWRPPRPPRPPYRPPVYPPPGRVYIPTVVAPHYVADAYVIYLPAGVLEPDEIDPAFYEKIDYLRSIGRADSFLVCLFQTNDPITDDEINYLFDQGVTFYAHLTARTAIIDASVENIFLLVMDMPNFRWIGEYLPEYKYRHEPPETNRRGAYVHSLIGDSNDFRNDLKHIGIQVVAYYEDTEDYYVVADWEEFPEIAELWWVEKVHKEPESLSDNYID